MKKLPWLDYAGQTTAELIACKESHRIDSLLCAFEEGIQAKIDPKLGAGFTDEEELVLALMALDREVNNGGYDQFFVNSSRQFAPVILSCLRRIDCLSTAAITERAIAALGLPELPVEAIAATIHTPNAARDRTLDACDSEFYHLSEITFKLFSFIEAHQDRIQLVKVAPPTRPQTPRLSNAYRLYIKLTVAKQKSDSGLDASRELAKTLALENSIPVTGEELEGAAVLHAFDRALRSRDLAACEQLAPLAFDLMQEETMHGVLHRNWVEQLIEASKPDLAEDAALAYLEYLSRCDQSTLTTQNRILFWAAFLQKHRAILPKSVDFFVTGFPDENLDAPLPKHRSVAEERPASRGLSRQPTKE